MGVFHPDLVGIQVRVLERLGSKHVLVVYGKDGMDAVDAIEGTPTAAQDRPIDPPSIESIELDPA